MINFNAPFLHHFFQMAVAQRIARVPAAAHQDQIDWETHSFGIEHGTSTRSVNSRVAYDLGVGGQCDRTKVSQLSLRCVNTGLVSCQAGLIAGIGPDQGSRRAAGYKLVVASPCAGLRGCRKSILLMLRAEKNRLNSL